MDSLQHSRILLFVQACWYEDRLSLPNRSSTKSCSMRHHCVAAAASAINEDILKLAPILEF